MKKKIAIVAGGYSGEYVISVKSASVISNNMDAARYDSFIIMITREKWVYLPGDGSELPVDRNDFTITISGSKVRFDCVLITVHGTPGEDGKLQGYFDMLGLPYTTSGPLACSLTFNKFFCNALARSWGVNVARSMKVNNLEIISAEEIAKNVNLPVFVKPNKGGSSLGTSLVRSSGDLLQALRTCLQHDDEALIEEYIEGTELTCGVYRCRGELIVLPVTEIVSKSGAKFFDYEAKYTQGASDEITPARISEDITQLVQQTTAMLYNKFELKGVSRIDYILKKDKLFFLEANITPGMSDRSIVPQQAAYIGISMRELLSDLIEEALR